MSIDLSKIQVYINCSGKSGSKTLEKTLSKYYCCLHTHGNFYFQRYIVKNTNINLYDCIKESMKNYEKVYVIDSYRLPLERAFSSSFQNKKNTTTSTFNYNLIIGENYSCIDETLYEFGLNLPEKFDFEKKYIEIIYKNLHIIKLRLTDSNEWSSILSNIFGCDIIVEHDNLSKDKDYYENYNLFLKNIKIPKIYFNNIIESKDFNYYNTIDEQQNYINKWSDKIIDINININNLPEDFDWKTYVDINKGRLQNMTELEVKIHYAQTGRFEGKKYKYYN